MEIMKIDQLGNDLFHPEISILQMALILFRIVCFSSALKTRSRTIWKHLSEHSGQIETSLKITVEMLIVYKQIGK